MPALSDQPRCPSGRALLKWQVSACEQIEFVQATLGQCGLAPHFHDVWSIGLILQGDCCFTAGGHEYHAPTGSVFILPPYEVHACRARDQATRYAVLYVEAVAMMALAPRLATQVRGCRPQRVWLQRPQLEPLFGRVAALREAAAAWRWLAELDQCLAGELEASYRDVGLHPLQLLFHKHWDEPIDLAAVQASLPQSRWHGIRTFRRATGLTPGAYLRQLRVQKSRRQLGGEVALAELALRLGFADQAHYTRNFKQVFGVTPGRWRHLLQQLNPTTAPALTAAASPPSGD